MLRLRHLVEDDEGGMKVTLIAVLDVDIETPRSISPDTHIAFLKETIKECISGMLVGDLTVTARKQEDHGRQMV